MLSSYLLMFLTSAYNLESTASSSLTGTPSKAVSSFVLNATR